MINTENLVSYIEQNNYNPIEMLPSFSTQRIETIYDKNNQHKHEDFVVTEITLENSDIRITLKEDGTWLVDFWKK